MLTFGTKEYNAILDATVDIVFYSLGATFNYLFLVIADFIKLVLQAP